MDIWKFLNCTPHEIAIRLGDVTHTIPASGLQARVDANYYPAEPIEGIPTVQRTLGEIVLPKEALAFEEADGWLIVSAIALEAIREYESRDFRAVAPDTGPTAIRAEGKIVAVTRFVRA